MSEQEQIKVLTVGVYDFFHLGHLNALEGAKKYGDYLIVGVHDDKLKSKGVDFLYTLEDRMRFVSNLSFVNKVVPYERIDILVQNQDFDVLACGPDQNHQYFQKAFDWCKANGKKVQVVERTEGISSTALRAFLKNHDI